MLVPEYVDPFSLTSVRVPVSMQHQSQEFGVNPQDLASMSQAELAMRMGSDQSMYSGWQKSGFKGQSRGKVLSDELLSFVFVCLTVLVSVLNGAGRGWGVRGGGEGMNVVVCVCMCVL